MYQHTLRFTSALYLSIACVFPNTALASKNGHTIAAIDVISGKTMASTQLLFEQATELIKQEKIDKGIVVLHQAAQQGHLKAILELASFYELGLGVTKDYARSIGYYEKAIEMGSVDARFNLALLLANSVNASISLASNLKKARSLMTPLAKQGDVDAQYSLSVMYKDKAGSVHADAGHSLYWLRLAANAGHVDAEFNLGLHYLRGEQVDQNIAQAFAWFKKAANRNMPRAQFNLALMYEKGFGTSVNTKRSVQWYESAAKLGNANAQQNLGIKYLLGDEVAKDENRALTLITKAARQEHRDAQFLLARIYQKGNHHIKADAKVAQKLYLLSAKQGHREAQYQLALMLSNKKEGQLDAKYWAYQATFAGHEKAYLLQARL